MFTCLICRGQGWGMDVAPDPGDWYGYSEFEVMCDSCNGTGKAWLIKLRFILLGRRLKWWWKFNRFARRHVIRQYEDEIPF